MKQILNKMEKTETWNKLEHKGSYMASYNLCDPVRSFGWQQWEGGCTGPVLQNLTVHRPQLQLKASPDTQHFSALLKNQLLSMRWMKSKDTRLVLKQKASSLPHDNQTDQSWGEELWDESLWPDYLQVDLKVDMQRKRSSQQHVCAQMCFSGITSDLQPLNISVTQWDGRGCVKTNVQIPFSQNEDEGFTSDNCKTHIRS